MFINSMEEIKDQINTKFTSVEQDNLLKLLNEYQDCFATDLTEVGKTHVTKMLE